MGLDCFYRDKADSEGRGDTASSPTIIMADAKQKAPVAAAAAPSKKPGDEAKKVNTDPDVPLKDKLADLAKLIERMKVATHSAWY